MRPLKICLTSILIAMAGVAVSACSPMPIVEPAIPTDIESIHTVVDKSTQEMRVDINGETRFIWDVSTARRGKRTPTGTYGAYWLSRHHRSSLYEDAPMPYSIFFHGDYAVHGTNWEQYLGSPASAGCVRLSNENAGILFELVEEHGKDVFTIEIND